MKRWVLLCLVPLACFAGVLVTENYTVTIESQCQEGEVSCSKYTYTGVNHSSGKSITLKGSSWHTLCPDRVTPCRFLGYQFRNGNVTYYVGQDGLLEVVRNGNKVLLSERGEWQ